jgi:rubrerythrin
MTGFDDFLAAVDRDGAIAETRAQTLSNRRRFLGLTAAGAAFALAGARRADAALVETDVDILNYALVLEYLQASFYTEAEQNGALPGRTARAVQIIGAVERAHVRAFRKLLGSRAVRRPLFDFQGTTEREDRFLTVAVQFEDLSVAAYKGQAPRIRSKPVLAAAIGIHSVEARHAAWMRALFGVTPAADAFDEPASRSRVTREVASTRFITAQPKTQARRRPKYTG